MPWHTESDVRRHNKKAASAGSKQERQWKDVANSVLERTGDEARAVRTANGVVKKRREKSASMRKSHGKRA